MKQLAMLEINEDKVMKLPHTKSKTLFFPKLSPFLISQVWDSTINSSKFIFQYSTKKSIRICISMQKLGIFTFTYYMAQF